MKQSDLVPKSCAGGGLFALGYVTGDLVAAEEPMPCLSAPWAHAQKGSSGVAPAMWHCSKRGGNPSPAAPIVPEREEDLSEEHREERSFMESFAVTEKKL